MMQGSVPIPKPNFSDLPIDLNTVGRVYIKEITNVSPHFAREIADRRTQNEPSRWRSISHFISDMNKKRKEEEQEITDEFKVSMQKARVAFNNKRFSFGDE